eukprot:Lithocolla_globosa_v1_NODE_723_length_3383_cov_3.240986.p2 type:complete len:114 gc:universal NODE_723_length_3383_cov_3.240986:1469-1810(+)
MGTLDTLRKRRVARNGFLPPEMVDRFGNPVPQHLKSGEAAETFRTFGEIPQDAPVDVDHKVQVEQHVDELRRSAIWYESPFDYKVSLVELRSALGDVTPGKSVKPGDVPMELV